MNCIITCTFDNESQRWTAASDDEYGLVLESNSFVCGYTGPINLHFKAERITQLEVAV